MEGFPYGFHNFLFGWIDTLKDNYPMDLDIDFVMTLFSIVEKIYSPAVTSIIGEALNKRLGTEGLSIPEMAMEVSK